MSKTPKSKENATFSFETVACMIAAYESGSKTLGGAAYEMMAELDGTRSANAFQHQFRDVKARAKELAAKLKAEGDTPSKKKTPAKRGMGDVEDGDQATPASSKKPKIVKKDTASTPIKPDPADRDSDVDDGFDV